MVFIDCVCLHMGSLATTKKAFNNSFSISRKGIYVTIVKCSYMLSMPMPSKVLSYLDIYIYKGYLIFFHVYIKFVTLNLNQHQIIKSPNQTRKIL